MIKIYGIKTCPWCDYLQPQIKGKEDKYQYIDIGAHVKNLHEFIDLRDNDPFFDKCKARGLLGIPLFVKEDGSLTFKAAEVGLEGYDPKQNTSCSIDAHKAGVKGC